MPEPHGRDQVIVLITDGEDHQSAPLQAAQQAAARGVKIFTVGLGDSAEGARIPIRDEKNQLRYLKDHGQEVWSKTDQQLLGKIAELTGGATIPVGTRDYDLGQIYEEHLAGLTRGEEGQSTTRKRFREQFQLFLALGVGLLMLNTLIPRYPRHHHPRTGAELGP
jgi:Ca-activated chloride channel family protein